MLDHKKQKSFHKNEAPFFSKFTMALKGKYRGVFQGCSSSPPCALLTSTEFLTLGELRCCQQRGSAGTDTGKDKRGLQLSRCAPLNGCGTKTPRSWHLLQSEMPCCFKVTISREQESQHLQPVMIPSLCSSQLGNKPLCWILTCICDLRLQFTSLLIVSVQQWSCVCAALPTSIWMVLQSGVQHGQ